LYINVITFTATCIKAAIYILPAKPMFFALMLERGLLVTGIMVCEVGNNFRDASERFGIVVARVEMYVERIGMVFCGKLKFCCVFLFDYF